MSELICSDCKFRTERQHAHRIYVGCKDKEKEKGFKQDNEFYRHTCSNYEKDKEICSECKSRLLTVISKKIGKCADCRKR